jgi:hypothetical protein
LGIVKERMSSIVMRSSQKIVQSKKMVFM